MTSSEEVGQYPEWNKHTMNMHYPIENKVMHIIKYIPYYHIIPYMATMNPPE